ncbi:ankyrin repeat domain-containing protein [Candidatus Dependentiae bacterium]|nr:ankyrin repeat domain-containing protein [Candidatus Dependentiae bacterium]
MYKNSKLTVVLSLQLLIVCPAMYCMRAYPDLYANQDDARFLGGQPSYPAGPAFNSNGSGMPQASRAPTEIEQALQAIESGADVNSLFNGEALLHLAARTGNLPLVECLLIKGANINLEDQQGYTPLYHALTAHKSDIARLLIANGACEKTSGHSAGLFAYARKLRISEDIVDQLSLRAKEVPTNTPISKRRNSIGHLPICDALRTEDFATFYILVNSASAAEINQQEHDGVTALHQAVMLQDLALHDTGAIEALLQQGANMNIVDSRGQTPLTIAHARSPKIEEFLLSRAAKHQAPKQPTPARPANVALSSASNNQDGSSSSVLGYAGIALGALAAVTWGLMRDK